MTPEFERDQAEHEEFWAPIREEIRKAVSAEFDRRNADLLEKIRRV